MKKLLNRHFAIAAVLLGCFSGHLSFSQTYTLSGTAVDYGNGLIRMTASEATSAQSASIWSTTKHDLTQPFDMSFDMFYGCNNNTATGGDGMTFTFQNESANALGAGFGFLGIGGNPTEMIQPAISIEFDTFDGSGGGGSNELPADHIAIDINGNVNNTNVFFDGLTGSVTNQAIMGGGRDLEDCGSNKSNYYTIRIVWDPVDKTLKLYEEGTLTMTYTSDLVNTIFGGSTSVYWGFTAATGTASNEQWIAPAGSLIPWECTTGNCCVPFDLTQTGPTMMCNDPIQIGVSGSYSSYKWSTGATTSTIDVSAPGFYSLTVLDNDGCPAIDTFTIAPTGPTATMTGDATICSDGTTSDVNVALTGASPYKFVYSIDGVRQDTVTTNSPAHIIQGTAPNVYTLDAVLDGSGCNGQTSGSATMNAYTELPIGRDTTFLSPGTAQLNVTDNGGEYVWYNVAGDSVGAGASFTTPTLDDTTTFYVIDTSIPAFVPKSLGLESVDDPAALVSTGTQDKTAVDVGLPKAVNTLHFVANENFKLERISCAIRVSASWVSSKIFVEINDLTTAGQYTKDSLVTTAIAVGDHLFLLSIDYNCIAGHSYSISYEGRNEFNGLGGSMSAISYNRLVNLAGLDQPPNVYHLTHDPEVDITYNTAPTTRYPGLFDWKISVGSPAALCGRTPVTAYPIVIVEPPVADVPLYIPNLMTPNKDGKNDLFEIKGLPDNSKLQIFNRWGVKVYANEAYNNTWAADNQSDGMYFFDLVLEEGTAYKGWVQIVR